MHTLGEVIAPPTTANKPQIASLVDTGWRVPIPDKVWTSSDTPPNCRDVDAQQFRQHRSQRIIKTLVCIDVETPLFPALFQRELFLSGVTTPFFGEKPDWPATIYVGLDQCQRAIGRAGIDNDNVATPTQALNAVAYIGIFIQAYDKHRERERALHDPFLFWQAYRNFVRIKCGNLKGNRPTLGQRKTQPVIHFNNACIARHSDT